MKIASNIYILILKNVRREMYSITYLFRVNKITKIGNQMIPANSVEKALADFKKREKCLEKKYQAEIISIVKI